MREMTFNKEPNLYGKQVVETRYAIYFQADNDRYPQKIAECNEDGAEETLEGLVRTLEKNDLAVYEEETDNGKEYTVSGTVRYEKDGRKCEEQISGRLYASSYLLILNRAQRKSLERVFKLYQKPRNNNYNNGGNRRNNNYRGRNN